MSVAEAAFEDYGEQFGADVYVGFVVGCDFVECPFDAFPPCVASFELVLGVDLVEGDGCTECDQND